MVGEDIISEVLEYLKKAGPTNTFRLASVMGIDRAKLLNLLKKLEEIQAIQFEHGNAVFLKFVSEEKPKSKPAEIEKPSPHPEQKIKTKSVKSAKQKALQLLQTENTHLKGKLSELKETVKELEKKASARPKTITRTVIEKVPVTKTIIKKVPVIKTVVKKIFVRPSSLPAKKEKELTVKKKLKLFSFKLPKFTFLKNIKKIKEPEFVK